MNGRNPIRKRSFAVDESNDGTFEAGSNNTIVLNMLDGGTRCAHGLRSLGKLPGEYDLSDRRRFATVNLSRPGRERDHGLVVIKVNEVIAVDQP